MSWIPNETKIIDLAPTASMVVNTLMNLKKHEELLIIVDSDTIMPMAYSLAFIASEIGAEYSICHIPNREKGFGRNPELVDALPRAVIKAFEGADAVVGLTNASSAPTVAPIRNELVFRQKKLRYFSITCRQLEAFTRGGCLADYQRIREDCRRVQQMMENSKEIKIETELGTDFSAEIPKIEDSPSFKGPYVRVEDGWADKPGTECGFPDGETFIFPKEYSANGVLVVNGPIEFVGIPEKPIKIYIEKGKIKKVEGECYEARRLQDLLNIIEDSDIIGEVAVGLNYKCLINGNVQEEKKALGTAHIGFGVAVPFPGTYLEKFKHIIHSDIVIRDATIKLDGKLIVQGNKLLI